MRILYHDWRDKKVSIANKNTSLQIMQNVVYLYIHIIGDESMKQAVNFRLDQQSIHMLSLLSDELNLTRTEIIERALLRYYERKHKKKLSPLSKLAGSINDEDSKAMLDSINEDKMNKSDDIEL